MKKVMVVIAAVLAFSIAAVLGAPAQARAQEKCELGTQGALAWAIATLIKVDALSGEDAIGKLSGMGIKPAEGWGRAEDCVTGPIKAQLQEAASRLLRDTLEGVDQLVETASQTILKSDQRGNSSESGL